MKKILAIFAFLIFGLIGCDSSSDNSTSSNSGSSSTTSGVSGTFTDTRDGQVYKWVKIGTQTWMAQNLNYRNTSGKNDTVGVCYNDLSANCATYGRLYTWLDVMNGASPSSANPSGTQGICPSGWHVPSDTEWGGLLTYVGADSARIKLSSTSGWNNNKNGIDDYNFTVLPAGYRLSIGIFNYADNISIFWSSSEYKDTSYAWMRSFNYNYAKVGHGTDYKSYGYSLRCIQN